MATIKDVAKRAGVSVTTVSRALNGTAHVKSETKEKIMKVIEELNFVPSVFAQGMRTKKSKTIGVVVPDYINPFYNVMFKHLQDQAMKLDYHVIISSTGEDAKDEIEYINDLMNRNIDGLIVCSYRGEQDTIHYLLEISKEIPVIFMDRFNMNEKVNAVYTDGYEGMKEVTEHLIGLGHLDIAFIKPLSRYRVANDRYKGYVDSMVKAGIGIRSEFIYEGNYHMQSGYEAAKYFMSLKGQHPTAIVAATDLMAIGAITYLKKTGVRIPEDIAVAGFDDIYLSCIIEPPLTTYRQPIKRIAQETLSLFMKKLNNFTESNKNIILKGELVIRRSTDISKSPVELIEEEYIL